MLVVSGVTTAPVEKPTPGSPALRLTAVAPTGNPPGSEKITDLVQSETAAYAPPNMATGIAVTARALAPGTTSRVV